MTNPTLTKKPFLMLKATANVEQSPPSLLVVNLENTDFFCKVLVDDNLNKDKQEEQVGSASPDIHELGEEVVIDDRLTII